MSRRGQPFRRRRDPLRAIASGGWVPSDHADGKFWWRADLGRTMVSTKVSDWTCQISGEVLTQGTDSLRPTVGSTGGQDALSFAGGFLRGNGFTTQAQAWTMVVVCELTGAGATQIILDDGDSNTNNWNLFYTAGEWRFGAGSSLSYAAGAKTGIHVHALHAESSSSEYWFDDFTTPVTTGNANTAAFESMTVGANHAGAAPATCLVSEIIVFNGDTIPTEMADYVGNRYSGLAP